MSTMALALHVVRRDLAQHRWIVLAWLSGVALATVATVVGEGVTQSGMSLRFFLPFGALFLAAGLVKIHPPKGAPPGTPMYWRTLPIPLLALLLGRVGAAAVLLLGFPLVGQAVALLALDTPAAQFPGHLGASARPLAGIVLAGLLVGSLTRGIGGAVILCTGLYILVLPLAFAMSVLGPGPGLLPNVPGLALVLHLGAAGLALWMLALRHSHDPGSGWTRAGAVAMVLVLVGTSQTGFFMGGETRQAGSPSSSPVEGQAGEAGFPVAVRDFDLRRPVEGRPGTGVALQDDAASLRLQFSLVSSPEAPAPSLVEVHEVTVQDAEGRVLRVHPSPGPPPRATRRDSLATHPEFSTPVEVAVQQDHLEGLRSGELSMVVRGRVVELEPMDPVELPLHVGARYTRGGTRITVTQVSDAEVAIRWSAFVSPVSMQARGQAGASGARIFGANLVETRILAPVGDGDRRLLKAGSSSGGGFGAWADSDLLLAGPIRESVDRSVSLREPIPTGARVQVNRLEPTRAQPFRLVLSRASWDREVR